MTIKYATYAAQWPILDEDRTLAQLIAEALPELHRMMAGEGILAMGDTDWSTESWAGREYLNARTPARRKRRRALQIHTAEAVA